MKFFSCSSAARLAFLGVVALVGDASALGKDIAGPPGSGAFGTSIAWLPNGNLIIADPFYDAPGPIRDVGAVHLYSAGGTHISSLFGASVDDQVGTRIDVLASGNFVVSSPNWRNPETGQSRAGAATWRSGSGGADAIVSASNSLVGQLANNQVSIAGVTVLPNGHYLVNSSMWGTETLSSSGAITWGNGETGTSGVVSSMNSIVGSTTGDAVGLRPPVWLSTGNVLVRAPRWSRGARAAVGAVRIVSGSSSTSGEFSESNSLVGSTAGDQIGGGEFLFTPIGGITVLPNGNVLVMSPFWDNGLSVDVGAATLVNGDTGLVEEVSASNSLVGPTANYQLGRGALSNTFSEAVTILSDSNFVIKHMGVLSPGQSVQGVTFGNGQTPLFGTVSASNSLIFSPAGGAERSRPIITALSNGNYVSRFRIAAAGAVPARSVISLSSGVAGAVGPVDSTNALFGAELAVEALSNGSFVVIDTRWSSANEADLGAVAWFDGIQPLAGEFDDAPLFTGANPGDRAGSIVKLDGGKYFIVSRYGVGSPGETIRALTWRDGAAGGAGSVSPSNSLIGNRIGVSATANGDYVVTDPAAFDDSGSATWFASSTAPVQPIPPSLSLVGQNPGDSVGLGVVPLANGNYLVISNRCSDIGGQDGALTLRRAGVQTAATVSSSNSLCGTPEGPRLLTTRSVADSTYLTSWSSSTGTIHSFADAESGSTGVLSAANSVDSGTFVVQDRAYDPVGKRWAFAKSSGDVVTIIGLNEVSVGSFADGFEP